MTYRRSVLLVILVFLVNAGLLLAYEWQLNGDSWNFPIDDAWIHMTFGRNLAYGLGFGVNPGEPAAASTSVVWALWLAFLHWSLGGFGMRAVVFAVKGSGILLAVVAILGAVRLLKRYISNDTDLTVAALLLLFSYPLAWGAVSGMEVPLCAACALWALVFQLSACGDAPGAYDREASIACWSLAFLARPENFLFACAAFFLFLWRERENRLRAAGAMLLIICLCVLPFVAFHASIAGQPFPHTFTSKMTSQALPRAVFEMPAAAAAREVAFCVSDRLRIALQFLFLENPLVGLLFAAAPFLFRRSGLRASVTPAETRCLVMAWAGLPLLAAAVALLTGVEHYTIHHGRYIPQTIFMAAFCGVAVGYRFWSSLGRPRWIVYPLLFALVFAFDRQNELANDYALECNTIRRIQVSLGRWLGRLPESLSIALNDIGAMSYFGRQRFIDLEGLISPEANTLRRQGRIDLFLEQARPDLLIIFPGWYPEIASRPELCRPIFTRSVEHNITGGGDVKAVYRMPWSRGLPETWPALPSSDLPEQIPVPSRVRRRT